MAMNDSRESYYEFLKDWDNYVDKLQREMDDLLDDDDYDDVTDYFDDNGDSSFCGACQESPCMCSDPG